jgi:leucyl aminopeptidase
MIKTVVTALPFQDKTAEGYVAFCEQGFDYEHHPVAQLQDYVIGLSEIIKQRRFSGALNSSLVLAGSRNGAPVYIMLYGLGSVQKRQEERLESYRRAIGNMVRTIECVKISTVSVSMPDPAWFEVDMTIIGRETTTTALMASYHFDHYITDPEKKVSRDFEMILSTLERFHNQLEAGLSQGQRIGYAVNQARYWCDLPANILTPTVMANYIKKVADTHDFKVTIFTEADIKRMGMGGLEAVSRGSAEECRLVVMEYQTDDPKAPTIGLVGKGITFDSGGLSIKPAVGMETMKDDMAGAAAVMSTMEAIAHLKPKVNVIALAPISENLPSGTATKPGDIIRFYNGKTAEVKNTDAEGRLILADAMAYAISQYKLDALIDIATLTGSCAAALGPFYCGLMSKYDELSNQLLQASERSGDRAWRLPFSDDYKAAIRSDVADMCNIGIERYRSGAITAGFFLQNFVGHVPWVHLDIAGPSFNVPDISYYRPGATGFGVRLFVEFLITIR